MWRASICSIRRPLRFSFTGWVTEECEEFSWALTPLPLSFIRLYLQNTDSFTKQQIILKAPETNAPNKSQKSADRNKCVIRISSVVAKLSIATDHFIPKRMGPKLNGFFWSMIFPCTVSPSPGSNFSAVFRFPLSVRFLGSDSSISRLMLFPLTFLNTRKANYPTDVSQVLKPLLVCTFLAPSSIMAMASMY